MSDPSISYKQFVANLYAKLEAASNRKTVLGTSYKPPALGADEFTKAPLAPNNFYFKKHSTIHCHNNGGEDLKPKMNFSSLENIFKDTVPEYISYEMLDSEIGKIVSKEGKQFSDGVQSEISKLRSSIREDKLKIESYKKTDKGYVKEETAYKEVLDHKVKKYGDIIANLENIKSTSNKELLDGILSNVNIEQHTTNPFLAQKKRAIQGLKREQMQLMNEFWAREQSALINRMALSSGRGLTERQLEINKNKRDFDVSLSNVVEQSFASIVNESFGNVNVTEELIASKRDEISKAVDNEIQKYKDSIKEIKELPRNKSGDYVKDTPVETKFIFRGMKNAQETINVLERLKKIDTREGFYSTLDDVTKAFAKRASSTGYGSTEMYVLSSLENIKKSIDKEEALLIDRAVANITKSKAPLLRHFPVLQHFKSNDPKAYHKIIDMADKIYNNSDVRYTRIALKKNHTNGAAEETAKKSSAADYSSRMGVALTIAETFFNKPKLVQDALMRKATYRDVGHSDVRLQIVLTEEMKYEDGAGENKLGTFSNLHNLIFVEEFWGRDEVVSYLPEEKTKFDFNSGKSTLIHEVTSALEIPTNLAKVDGAFEDWSSDFNDKFLAERKKRFELIGSKEGMSYDEEYSGLGDYAFSLTDVKDGKGMADNYLSELVSEFRYNPHVVKKYNPVHYQMMVEYLGYDPSTVLPDPNAK